VTDTIEAAVAVLLREDGQVLLGERPAGKPWAGWWEFPGGKIEAEETPFHALQRELHEELGTEAVEAYPWLTRSFAYPERTVKLHFFIVRRWRGEPHGKENQQLAWQSPEAPTVAPLLPANAPVLQALRLPSVYAISHRTKLGEAEFLSRLDHALHHGLKLVQVREPQLGEPELLQFTGKVVQACRAHGARVLLNSEPELAGRAGVDGVHLSASRLMALHERPSNLLCAASCHNAEELAKAAALELDFVLLSPVKPTLSHLQTSPLGWQTFAFLIKDFPLPVYALGGMLPADLSDAWMRGAHGIAMQREIWKIG
jgi:8-oxo-dGTP diphosphatase